MRDDKLLLLMAKRAEQLGDFQEAWRCCAELASSEYYAKAHPEIHTRMIALEHAARDDVIALARKGEPPERPSTQLVASYSDRSPR